MNRSLPDITESATELKDRLRSESVGYKKTKTHRCIPFAKWGCKESKASR